MSEQLGMTTKKDNFGEWYLEVVQKAGLADYTPIEGCIVFMPYSYAMWENIQAWLDKRFKETGHRNAYFPLFIPEGLLKKEAEHFKGFVPEVAWVTHGGSGKLGERLAVRPTSETIINTAYSKWIRSWRDLPLLLNQWCNIVRWETKAAKPFLRTKEFLWQEGHTVHATEPEAEEEALRMLEIYKMLMEDLLAVPVITGTKSEREKFAGAKTTYTLEAIMPDGKALQMGTTHNLGQHFAKAFDITFIDKDEQRKHAWTTSWGVSTRMLGALILTHGDDSGLVLPPAIAPQQCVIIPIFKENEKARVMEAAKEIADMLTKSGIRVHVDSREQYTPGWKFNEWELKGVPVRIEIGPKDMAANQAMIVRRDTGKKTAVKTAQLQKEVQKLVNEIQSDLFTKAKKYLDTHIFDAKDLDEIKKLLEKKGFVRIGWCGSDKCEEKLTEQTTATIRCIPQKKERLPAKCALCGSPAKVVAYIARAY